ncbi:hypothetical protein Q427_18335 [Halomonas sp. BC04]|nr:hypothetical protein Q427_18335 [Halomonas sp. BC04]
MPGLSGGLSLIPVLIGIFAISEVVVQGSKLWRRKVDKLMDDVAEQASLLQGYDISKDKLTWLNSSLPSRPPTSVRRWVPSSARYRGRGSRWRPS